MLQKTDLAEIAVEVARETRLTILNLLHQKIRLYRSIR